MLQHNQVVKPISAILFSLLLVLGQFAPAQTTRACKMNVAAPCGMACCAAKQSSGSQPVPAAPSQSNVLSQNLFVAPASVVWTLPKKAAASLSCASKSSLLAMSSPIYARNCSLLL
jgi:hypothetical protein